MKLNELVEKIKNRDTKIAKSYLMKNFELKNMQELFLNLIEKIKNEKGFLTNEEVLKTAEINMYLSQVIKAPYINFIKLVKKF